MPIGIRGPVFSIPHFFNFQFSIFNSPVILVFFANGGYNSADHFDQRGLFMPIENQWVDQARQMREGLQQMKDSL